MHCRNSSRCRHALQALHLLAAMWEGGHTLAPDTVSYNTVLKACANAFQLVKATEVYSEMVQRWASRCAALRLHFACACLRCTASSKG
jgi:pentatricopeptide repeat protein